MAAHSVQMSTYHPEKRGHSIEARIDWWDKKARKSCFASSENCNSSGNAGTLVRPGQFHIQACASPLIQETSKSKALFQNSCMTVHNAPLPCPHVWPRLTLLAGMHPVLSGSQVSSHKSWTRLRGACRLLSIRQAYLRVFALVEGGQLELAQGLAVKEPEVADCLGTIPWNRVVVGNSVHLRTRMLMSLQYRKASSRMAD